MKLSTKARYGTRAMLDLAPHYGQGLILVKDIARRQQISELYSEHLLMLLKAAGMVRSIRGARGGYTLAVPPSQISVSDIVQALEGSVAPVDCVDDPEVCPQADMCVPRDFWTEMKKAVNGVLESTTLQDLVQRQVEKEAAAQA